MAGPLRRMIDQWWRGVIRAIAGRPATFAGAAVATLGLSLLLPPLVLSLARTPVDYFTFNPWLRRLPEYLASPQVPWSDKLAKLPDLALFWFSSDSAMGGTEWGFAVDVRDVGRMVATAVLVGAYFALWAYARALRLSGRGSPATRPVGALGVFVSVLGLSTGPCSVMGCGAPVLPVVGLAFVGLASTTLAALSTLSVISSAVVLAGLAAGVAVLGWRVGAASPSAESRTSIASRMYPRQRPDAS